MDCCGIAGYPCNPLGGVFGGSPSDIGNQGGGGLLGGLGNLGNLGGGGLGALGGGGLGNLGGIGNLLSSFTSLLGKK
jgi:hypothetical protein